MTIATATIIRMRRKETEHVNAALPEWLRGMPAKCMRKRAKVQTLQAAILFNFI